MSYPIFGKVDPVGVKISGLTMTHFECSQNLYLNGYMIDIENTSALF